MRSTSRRIIIWRITTSAWLWPKCPTAPNQAIAQFQAALEIKPDYLRAHTDLGSAYAKLGRFSDAMAEFRAAIAIDPDLPIPHNNLGNTYAQLGMWNEAISEYQTALRLDPEYTGARNSLAEAEYSRAGAGQGRAEVRGRRALGSRLARPPGLSRSAQQFGRSAFAGSRAGSTMRSPTSKPPCASTRITPMRT
jgi:tetratricopeptide (TPR) repeat protein